LKIEASCRFDLGNGAASNIAFVHLQYCRIDYPMHKSAMALRAPQAATNADSSNVA
jgi:hypothetical protein